MKPSSIVIGALVLGTSAFSGWAVRDIMHLPPACRDSLRRIAPDDQAINCPYGGQSAVLLEIQGRPVVLCSCDVEVDAPRKGTTL